MNPELRRLIVETAAWLGLAAVAWVLSYDFAGRDMLFRWGAEFWPRTVCGLIAIVALIQFAVRYRAAVSHVGEPAEEAPRYSVRDRVKLGATFAIPLLYVFLMPRMGYFLLTPFFIASMMFLFGIRRAIHLVGTTLLIYGGLLLVFSKLLVVPLPTGYWPGFYDVGVVIAEYLSGR